MTPIELHCGEKTCKALGMRHCVVAEVIYVHKVALVHACDVNRWYIWPLNPVLSEEILTKLKKDGRL